jgi:hypothetical protein
MKGKRLWMLVAVLTALLTIACGNDAAKEQKKEADQKMEATYKAKDYKLMLSTADSLEQAGCLSAVKANYWRGYAYDRLKQKEEAERYWKVSMEAGEETTDPEDFEMYARSASHLANLLCIKTDYEGALKTAQAAVERLEEQKCDTTSDYINLLIYVGCSQAAIGKEVEESKHGFFRAYNKHLENIKKKRSDAAYKDAIAGLINVAFYCVKAEKYQEALYYTRYFGELLAEYELRPHVSEEYVDRQVGRYNIYKAQALRGLGQEKEAAETFEAFQTTEFSTTAEGLSLAEEYIKAGL